MFFAKIPRHTRQNAITEGDLECILTRNCKGTEQLQILFLIDKPGGDPCKYQKVNKQDHNSRKCKAFTSRNASDHVACLGKRKRGYELSDKARKLLSGKEGVAKISHRHDDVVGNAVHRRGFLQGKKQPLRSQKTLLRLRTSPGRTIH